MTNRKQGKKSAHLEHGVILATVLDLPQHGADLRGSGIDHSDTHHSGDCMQIRAQAEQARLIDDVTSTKTSKTHEKQRTGRASVVAVEDLDAILLACRSQEQHKNESKTQRKQISRHSTEKTTDLEQPSPSCRGGHAEQPEHQHQPAKSSHDPEQK